VEECTITILIEQIDRKTGGILKKKPKFVTTGSLVRCMIECAQPVCLELFSDVPQLGRFTLRDEGKTIAIGKVTALGPKKKPAAEQQQQQ
jgi:peptide chain release factor subunit 3